MPSRCVVPQCRGNGGFKFPTDPDLNMEWRVAIKRMGPDKTLWKPGHWSVVCEKHFIADDFKEPKNKFAGFAGTGRTCRSLKEGTIPSVFSLSDKNPGEEAAAQWSKQTEERKRNRETETEKGWEAVSEEVPAPEAFFDTVDSVDSSLVCSKDKQFVNGAKVNGLYKETPLAPTSMSDDKATKVSVEGDPGELSSDSEHFILPDRDMKRCDLKAEPPDTEKVEEEDAATIVCRWTSPQLCAKAFASVFEFNHHVRASHIEVRANTDNACYWSGCGNWGRPVDGKYKMFGHVRSHVGDRPFTCAQQGCGKDFRRLGYQKSFCFKIK